MKAFFQKSGDLSMARLLCLLSVLGGIIVGAILALTKNLDVVGATFCGGLVTAGITGKAFTGTKENVKS